MRLIAFIAAFSSLFLAASPYSLAAAEVDLDARTKTLKLNEIAMKTVENHFLPDGKRKTLAELVREFSQGKTTGKPKGIFVTLSKMEKPAPAGGR